MPFFKCDKRKKTGNIASDVLTYYTHNAITSTSNQRLSICHPDHQVTLQPEGQPYHRPEETPSTVLTPVLYKTAPRSIGPYNIGGLIHVTLTLGPRGEGL